MGDLLERLTAAVRDGDRDAVARDVRQALEAGEAPRTVLTESLIPGLRQMGELFKDGHAYLPEILDQRARHEHRPRILQPHLADDAPPGKGVVVLGTVEGDLHDIGKRLVGMLLRGNGFEVVDLGVDVDAASFAAAVEEHGADIVALSALLTTTTPEFDRVLEALAVRGLRERVLVMVGGAPVSRALADEIGADGFADDCILAVDEAERLMAARDAGGAP